MPGLKRASADDDDGRTAKRSRGPPSPAQQDSAIPTTDELGFETDEVPPSRALMASSERCEAAWHEFVAARRSEASDDPGDFEGRPDVVREFVRRK